MKVLFVASVDIHIKSFHIPYLKWFSEHGYEVHVATNGNETFPHCDKKHVISFERSPFGKRNIKAYIDLKKLIEEEKFDIIHTHTPVASVLTRFAARNARRKGTKVIYTAHGFHFYKGAPILNWIIYYPIEKWLSKYTDCLITINNEDYERAKRFRTKRVELMHGVGISEEKFKINMTDEEKVKLRKSIGCNEESFILLYVAELNKNKNQKLLIDVTNELLRTQNNIHLVLAGKGSLEKEYKEYSKKLKLENNIHIIGYRKDIPQLISISNLGVASSLREGLGLNIIEYGNLGMPTIAVDNRGHREILDDKYLVSSKEDFVNKILTLYKNREKYERAVKDINIDKFLLQNVVQNMSKVYIDIQEGR